MGGHIHYLHGTSKGVAILVKKVTLTVKGETDLDGRFLASNCKLGNNNEVVIANVYAPNTDDPHFFSKSVLMVLMLTRN